MLRLRAPGVADHRDHVAGELEGLGAADGVLHRGVEVLHADRGAGEPGGAQRVEAGARRSRSGRSRPRRSASAARGGGRPRSAPQSSREHGRGQDRRRAAAEVDRGHLHVGAQVAADEGELGLELGEVGDERAVGRRALGAAGAEPAEPAAVGDVDVERDARARRGSPRARRPPAAGAHGGARSGWRAGSSCSAGARASKRPRSRSEVMRGHCKTSCNAVMGGLGCASRPLIRARPAHDPASAAHAASTAGPGP